MQIAYRYEYYDEVDSTNESVKKRAEAGEQEGLIISADIQTRGRGRDGRVWVSPQHDNIATSLLLRPKKIMAAAVPMITILAGMAVRDAIEAKYGLAGQIKWPNDIIMNGKKVCGILVEMSVKDMFTNYVIVGIGVNVHNKKFAPEIADKATSVDLQLRESGKESIETSRKDLLQEIWKNFMKYYMNFLETGDLRSIREQYEIHMINRGGYVRIQSPKGSYDAIAEGIDDQGGLVVGIDGKRKVIRNYEVSVRGLCGYV